MDNKLLQLTKFKDIPWYEWQYQCNWLWEVKSLSRFHKTMSGYYTKEKILKQHPNPQWYYLVSLWTDNKKLVSRLVAETFIPNLENKPFVNHIDLNPKNNNINNLEWCNAKENANHYWKTSKANWYWKWKLWKEHKDSKPVLQLDNNWKIIKEWASATEISRELWINQSCISAFCLWKYKWEILRW
jgi:hypothetical protein